jgi:vacuolar-type H+-ATPase subunit D/Vma8
MWIVDVERNWNLLERKRFSSYEEAVTYLNNKLQNAERETFVSLSRNPNL